MKETPQWLTGVLVGVVAGLSAAGAPALAQLVQTIVRALGVDV